MRIIARKCKDGWITEMKETRVFKSKKRLEKVIHSLGLKIRPECSNKKRIYADD